MKQCFFLTGTDTNIGKTISACALLQNAIANGYRAVGYKPVSSGCKLTANGIRNTDALMLLNNSNIKIKYKQINPISLIEPTSPHIASQNERKNINIKFLSKGLRNLEKKANWIIIEGAGGWFTPLNEYFNYSDWLIIEQLPVILVVGIKIGCINHALLTALAIHNARLKLVGWIANHLTLNYNRSQEYLTFLKKNLKSPLIGEIPWLNNLEQLKLTNYLKISLLELI